MPTLLQGSKHFCGANKSSFMAWLVFLAYATNLKIFSFHFLYFQYPSSLLVVLKQFLCNILQTLSWYIQTKSQLVLEDHPQINSNSCQYTINMYLIICFCVRYCNTTVKVVLSLLAHLHQSSELHLRSDSLVFSLYQIYRYTVCLKTLICCTSAKSSCQGCLTFRIKVGYLFWKPLQFVLSHYSPVSYGCSNSSQQYIW